MSIFFTADWHLGHRNIIKYCNRPFSTVEEMDDVIIKNCNRFVRENDTLYMLGDFTLTRNIKRFQEYLERIDCENIEFIVGSHDDKSLVADCFGKTPRMLEIKHRGQKITLCHYAMRRWHCSHYGAWHLYGHSHCNLEPFGLSFDVGVDGWDFKPASFDEIKIIMDAFIEKGDIPYKIFDNRKNQVM